MTALATTPPKSAPFASAESFAQVDFERRLASTTEVSSLRLRDLYHSAASEPGLDEAERSVFTVLGLACSIFLDPGDASTPWRPMATFTDGSTTVTPQTFKGAQVAVFADLIADVRHPGLRARLADLIWSLDRRAADAARSAITAYLECAFGLMDGRFSPRFPKAGGAAQEVVGALQRAMQIFRVIRGKGADDPEIRRGLDLAIAFLLKDRDYVPFTTLAEVALEHKWLTPADLAATAEALAAGAPAEDYPEAVGRVWRLAARLHERLRDAEGRQRCLLGSARCVYAMRQFVLGRAGTEAYWVKQTLLALRAVKDQEAWEIELEVELRRLQKLSVDEFASFEIDLGIDDERDAHTAAFASMTLSEGLKNFALLEQSPDPEALRRAARERAAREPLTASIGTDFIDDRGRTAAKAPGAPVDEDPEEAWYRRMINDAEGFRRAQTVAGRIEPARLVIHGLHALTERMVGAAVRHSAAVPGSQGYVVTVGLTRFLQGDFVSAVHILIPQIEPILREILRSRGVEPSKIRDDGTEEDFSIGSLFDRHRDALTKALGAPLAEEIDRLFNAKPGPRLRHELAHGQMSSSDCVSSDALYGCWLIYRLVLGSLAAHWERLVEPGIDAEV